MVDCVEADICLTPHSVLYRFLEIPDSQCQREFMRSIQARFVVDRDGKQ